MMTPDHTDRDQRSGGSRGRRRTSAPPPSGPEQERLIGAWFAGRVPGDRVEGGPDRAIDDDEIQVVGTLAPPALPEGAHEDEVRVAEQARIAGLRDERRNAPARI